MLLKTKPRVTSLYASATSCSKKAVVYSIEKLFLQATSQCNVQLAKRRLYVVQHGNLPHSTTQEGSKNKSPSKGGLLYKGQTEFYWKLWVDWKVLAEYSELHNLTCARVYCISEAYCKIDACLMMVFSLKTVI